MKKKEIKNSVGTFEDLENIKISTYQTFTFKELQDMFKKVKTKYNKTHKNIQVGFGYDYSTCYYESDTPDPQLEFIGDKRCLK
jgi:hypothetical protein